MKNSKPITRWICTALLVVCAAAFSMSADCAAPAGKVDLNTASVKELEAVPGISKKGAQAIVSHRKKTPFHSVDELQQVKGFKGKAFKKIEPLVTVQS